MKGPAQLVAGSRETGSSRATPAGADTEVHLVPNGGMQRDRIEELDGLRAIAILLVIGCHYHWFAARLSGLPKFGWIGVDVFFVLSGYLITSILLRLKGSAQPFRYFYWRRCLRILPPLALALFAMGAACAVTGDARFFSPRFLLTNALFLQSFGSPGFLLHPQFHSLSVTTLRPSFSGLEGSISSSAGVLWSLSIEEYFYLLWAPVVLLLSRKSIMQLAITICVGEMIFRWLYFRGRQDYFSIYHRFDALIYGAIVALLFHQLVGRRWMVRLTGTLSAILILFVAWRSTPMLGLELRDDPTFMVFGLPLFAIFVGSMVSLIVMEAGSPHPAWRILRSWPVRTIGVLSYTLYLIHTLVYLSVGRVVPSPIQRAFLSLGVALLLSWLSWHFIESPILAIGQGRRAAVPKL